MGGDDIVHRIRELRGVLKLGLKHFIGENGVRMIEDATEERVHELAGDPVAEPAGSHLATGDFAIIQSFQHALGDQPSRVALLISETTPKLRHQQ
jgi:hypothetical protein